MATSPAFISSFLNIPSTKISILDAGFPKFRKRQSPIHLNSISFADTSSSRNSATVTIDHNSTDDEDVKKAESILGSNVRVKVPLKIYHVSKLPDFDLMGRVGVVKQYVGVHKGKRISANLPYKVEFVTDEALGRDGKPVKFVAHLKEDEFEIID